jgi:hypothetical protein
MSQMPYFFSEAEAERAAWVWDEKHSDITLETNRTISPCINMHNLIANPLLAGNSKVNRDLGISFMDPGESIKKTVADVDNSIGRV